MVPPLSFLTCSQAPGATPLPTPTPTPSAVSSHPVGLVDVSFDQVALNTDSGGSSLHQSQPGIGLNLGDARCNAVADTQATGHIPLRRPPRVLPPYCATAGLTTHLPSPAFHGHRDLLCPPMPRDSLHPLGRRFNDHHVPRPVADVPTTYGGGHQATDMNHQNPNERRRYSYLQHDHEAHVLIRRTQQPSMEVPDVTTTGFPPLSRYSCPPGTIIYAAEVSTCSSII